MTFKEKAEKVAKELVEDMDLPSFLEEGLKTRIFIALKEQDRDTRHACAGAVVMLPGVDEVGKDKAHAACMNVRQEG